jgi:hypothetical protein
MGKYDMAKGYFLIAINEDLDNTPTDHYDFLSTKKKRDVAVLYLNKYYILYPPSDDELQTYILTLINNTYNFASIPDVIKQLFNYRTCNIFCRYYNLFCEKVENIKDDSACNCSRTFEIVTISIINFLNENGKNKNKNKSNNENEYYNKNDLDLLDNNLDLSNNNLNLSNNSNVKYDMDLLDNISVKYEDDLRNNNNNLDLYLSDDNSKYNIKLLNENNRDILNINSFVGQLGLIYYNDDMKLAKCQYLFNRLLTTKIKVSQIFMEYLEYYYNEYLESYYDKYLRTDAHKRKRFTFLLKNDYLWQQIKGRKQ